MSRRIFTAALALLSSLMMMGQQLDSTKLAPLDSLLESYYSSMIAEPVSVKEAECDFLISSCRDSLVRQWVATRILEHYIQDPPLMGEEEVGIYVYDKWFASSEVKMADEWTEFQAKLFVDFNRNSMIGMKAPVLQMYSPFQDLVRIPRPGTVSVLYFYDTSCSKCKLTSPVLPHVFDEVTFPVTLFALYTGSDAEEWAQFRKDFTCANPYVTVVHLSDPDMDSDYQRMYGVTATPRLYVVSPKGVIDGRRLDIESLMQIIGIYQSYYDESK